MFLVNNLFELIIIITLVGLNIWMSIIIIGVQNAKLDTPSIVLCENYSALALNFSVPVDFSVCCDLVGHGYCYVGFVSIAYVGIGGFVISARDDNSSGNP